MKILLIQLRAIGDVICTIPAVDYLKQIFPDSQIDFLVEPASRPLLESHPQLNRVLVYDKTKGLKEIFRIRRGKYEAVLDFLNNPRSAYLTFFSQARWRVGFHRKFRGWPYNLAVRGPGHPLYVPVRKIYMIDRWLEAMGVSSQSPRTLLPHVHLNSDDERFAEDWFKTSQIGGKKLAVIMPAHKHPICRWRAEGFRDVARHLADRKDVRVILAWGPGEESVIKDIYEGLESKIGLVPPQDLRKFGALLKRSALLLSNNSGSMHLGVSVGTPTVTIYGPTRPVDWNPAYSGIPVDRPCVALQGDVPCLGCRLKKCPIHHLCMRELKTETVIEACDAVLDGSLRSEVPK